MPVERIKLRANEIKPRLQRLKREALKIEPKLVVRINTIGATLSKYKDELLDKKQFLIEFLNEFYYDIETYLYDIKPRLNLPQEEITEFLKQKNLSVTEWYWYSEILPMWFSLQDPKFSNWIEKLLLEEYKGDDQALIFALTQKINAKSDGSASHRYVLDLSMATDLLVSHVPSELEPVFIQLKGIPIFRDGQRNPDFISEQQRWHSTLTYWRIKRCLLISHDASVKRLENLVSLADAILKESNERTAEFIATIPFPE